MFERLKSAFLGVKDTLLGSQKPKEPKEIVKKEIELPNTNVSLEQKDAKISYLTKIKSAFKERYKLSENEIESIVQNIELTLLQSDISIDASAIILSEMKEIVRKDGLIKGIDLSDAIKEVFISSLEKHVKSLDIVSQNQKKPYVIMFIGTNGSGKTTSIAKFAKFLQKRGKSVLVSACDTFRAASIEQLEGHAKKLDIPIVSGKYGQDPTSVAYDSIAKAKSTNIDYVLIDTAGRQNTSDNLIRELEKIKRIIKPDFSVFVLEATLGHAASVQASDFDSKIGYDAFILTKADVDDKGGTLITLAVTSKKPVLFLGIGQGYDDLKPFDKSIFDNLFE